MNHKKSVGFGVLLWLIIFALVSAFLGFYQTHDWMSYVFMVVAATLSFVFARLAKPATYGQGICYGLIFAGASLILDFVITRQFNDGVFADWRMWLGYILIALAPLLAVKRLPGAPVPPPPSSEQV